MNLFSKKTNIILFAVLGVVLVSLITLSIVLLVNSGDKADPTSSQGSSIPVSNPSSVETSSSAPSSSDTVSSEPEEIKLSVTSPSAKDVTVNTPSFTVRGSADPAAEITLNGEKLSRYD